MKSLHPHINGFYKKFKKKLPTPQAFAREIIRGNTEYLSRAITLVESQHPDYSKLGEEIVNLILPHTGKSFRIGITGVPGAGKSTFIDRLGKQYIANGHRIAILAIDPSSAINKGSILGDKTRMEQLIQAENVFIRPSPGGNRTGGVSNKTRESILLCEAAGYDRILVETIGVGQSEIYVHSMTDFFLLLKIPTAGDELQGIKRGVMEMADAIIINKADGNLKQEARKATQIFKTALHYFTFKKTDDIPVMQVSSLENKGIDKVYEMLENKFQDLKKTGLLEQKRSFQRKYWLEESLNELFRRSFVTNKKLLKKKEELEQKVIRNIITPYSAAEELWQFFLSGK